jgi:hypothetical protein
VIAGIGGPFAVLVAFGAIKLFASNDNDDGPKSIDDFRMQAELLEGNKKSDSDQ